MKLRNKRTGEILGSLGSFIIQNPNGINCETITKYDSLAELNEEWEDYEEPKEFWFVDADGKVEEATYLTENDKSSLANFGNYFSTKEEAEKAVEKLKAWKRLRDKGVKFNCWYGGSKDISFSISQEIIDKTTAKDLDLLFGGGE